MQISKISVNFQAKPAQSAVKKAADSTNKIFDKFSEYAYATPTGEYAAEKNSQAKELAEDVKMYFPYGNITGPKIAKDIPTEYPYINEATILQ